MHVPASRQDGRYAYGLVETGEIFINFDSSLLITSILYRSSITYIPFLFWNMALDSWLIRVKSALCPASVKSSTTTTVGILAFEVAAIMAKLLHIWRSLSDNHLLLVHRHSISLRGTRKLVSDDHDFLLSLACAEFTETLRLVGTNISPVLTSRCTDPELRHFSTYFLQFAETGQDERRWAMTSREMEGKVNKMERLVCATGELYKEMTETAEMERSLGKLSQNSITPENLRQKILLKKLNVKRVKETSLWARDFDTVTLVLVRSAFTILARIKKVFHLSERDLPQKQLGFFESNSKALVPPPSTLGSAALALRYANLVVIIEKMVRSPRAIGPDIRDVLYTMLPDTLQSKLRSRLRSVARCPVTDVRLANEWRLALATIVDWLGPLAHNTLRWQSERSLEKSGGSGNYFMRSGVLMLQTLHFAVSEKVETAIAELLVGVNYVWRFEMEMAMMKHTTKLSNSYVTNNLYISKFH